MPRMSQVKVIRTVLCVLAGLLFCGCRTFSFYSQAVGGECRILARQKPISRLIADPETDPRLKAKLEEVLKIRQFARDELKLPADKQYLKYVDLRRPYVVWNVYAAPELSLEPKTWWFPIIGEASYRGYFSEKGARKYADYLEKKGWDVFVGGVETYSTLGWFHDPILNTFIWEPPGDLAEIVFHELTHQRLFIADDTDFNEALATAVAEEGVRRWFERQHQPEEFARYHLEQERQREFNSLVLGTTEKLDALYTNSAASVESKVAGKKELIEQLRAEHENLKAKWGGHSPYDEWFNKPVNNAKLSTVATYYELVPAFNAVLAANGNDLERFFAVVEKISKFPPEQREDALRKAGEK